MIGWMLLTACIYGISRPGHNKLPIMMDATQWPLAIWDLQTNTFQVGPLFEIL